MRRRPTAALCCALLLAPACQSAGDGPLSLGNFAGRLLGHTFEHLVLVAASLGAAVLVAVPLGIRISRHAPRRRTVLRTLDALQTIPALILLALMVPLTGGGAGAAVFALFLYSAVPILHATLAGITEIPPAAIESAEALGLPADAQLRLVQLPLALPALLGGIGTAAVRNVGTATVAAMIGAGGYGQPILAGIARGDSLLILLGAAPAALFALAVHVGCGRLEHQLISPGLRLHPDAPTAPDEF